MLLHNSQSGKEYTTFTHVAMEGVVIADGSQHAWLDDDSLAIFCMIPDVPIELSGTRTHYAALSNIFVLRLSEDGIVATSNLHFYSAASILFSILNLTVCMGGP